MGAASSGTSMSEIVDTPLFRALKLFVVLAGIAIVAGLVLLIWLLVTRNEEAGRTEAPPRAGASSVATQDAHDSVPLPPGAEVTQVAADGQRIVLLGRVPGQGQFVAVLDAATGGLVRLVRLQPGPPP
jgi:hypothetical protein